VKYSIITSNGKYLYQLLRSVAWQTFTDYELIVVDWDAEPPLVVPEPARVLRWSQRGAQWNHSICRNFATANARADRLVFVNCDCLMAPDLLERADAMLDEDPTCQVYWQRFDLSEIGTRMVLDAPLPEALFWPGQLDPLWGELHGLSTYGDFLVVSRDVVMKYGGYDERMAGWGVYDQNLACRLERAGHRVVWGEGMGLAHFWHARDTAYQDRTWRANIDAGEKDWLDGVNVANRGRATFDGYVVG